MTQRLVEITLHTLAHFRLYRLTSFYFRMLKIDIQYLFLQSDSLIIALPSLLLNFQKLRVMQKHFFQNGVIKIFSCNYCLKYLYL